MTWAIYLPVIWASISLDNGFSLVHHKTLSDKNAGFFLSIRPLTANFNKILIRIQHQNLFTICQKYFLIFLRKWSLSGIFMSWSRIPACQIFWAWTWHGSIDPSHKSHDALVPYPIMQHFVAEMCTRVHISVTKCCIVGYWSDALWDLWDGSISWESFWLAIYFHQKDMKILWNSWFDQLIECLMLETWILNIQFNFILVPFWINV